MKDQSETSIPDLSINVKDVVGVASEIKDAARFACSLIFNKFGVKPSELNLIFTSHIVNAQSEEMDHSAEAFPDGKTIVLAVESRNFKAMTNDFGPVATVLLITAHEATHIVQTLKGDPPPSSATLSPKQYEEDRHEVEAWKESLDLFKGLRAHAKGIIIINGKEYEIPEESKYKLNTRNFPKYIIG